MRDISNKDKYPATTYVSTDSETYNAGRSEGNADVAAELRKIIDPEDKKHLNLSGLLKEIELLIKYKEKANEVITYIREADALKEFGAEAILTTFQSDMTFKQLGLEKALEYAREKITSVGH